MNICRYCGQAFTPLHAQARLCSSECVKAQNKISRSRYRQQKGKEKERVAQANWRKNNPERARLILKRAEATTKGLPFNLTIEDMVIPGHCPVFGTPFDSDNPAFKPELDRLVPEKGYVKGNVCFISARANSLKSNASVEELEKILEYIEKKS